MAPKPPPAKRNPGCAFDADWVASVRVNRSANHELAFAQHDDARAR